MQTPKVTIKELPDSLVEIEGEIDADSFEKFRKHAVEHLNNEVKMDGFRQGHIPEAVLSKKIGEMAILEEMANGALGEAIGLIVNEHKLDTIGRPEVNITKIASKNPLGFKIKIAVLPKFELSDYKKISKKAKLEIENEKLEVTEKELDETLEGLRSFRANNPSSTEASEDTLFHEHKEGEIHTEGDNKTQGSGQSAVGSGEVKLPELNDEFAKSLGKFETLDALKEKLRENILTEKKNDKRHKIRNKIIQDILKEVKINAPNVLINREIEIMMSDLKQRAAESGAEFEDYLNEVKKTEEDLRNEWKPVATERTKGKLLLRAIGVAEKVTIPSTIVESEAERMIKLYPDANKEAAKMYIEEQLTTEKIFNLLEGAE
ncbi:MAG: hypothetical protein HZA95_00980 [Candidatus Vogelbacteria bacterium]|nr:hypothetical protein [Candidatus Vogelbacteria bacterium]